ncbi:DVU0298 family protein [uncultured Desulfobacter sp.]|uniref:DVU0298 family protein n=1 Tax=uncultured Desulfobacter sp. TaxID=240139 RepID=UPI0029F5C45B|nr:DVU0298 family protein [uncultured Desulfobacter sp.]
MNMRKRTTMKPYGRKVKKQVGEFLSLGSRSQALDSLAQIPDAQLTGHLFSFFYNKDELIKFRSVTAMGELVARIADNSLEKARIILRRIMWNLNDESGGIGWGSPEAMGEILSKSPALAQEFKTILFSYLDHRGNHIEHEMLQRGVLWGIGTYIGAAPDDLTDVTKEQLIAHLSSKDPVKCGYAVRALSNAHEFECMLLPDLIQADKTTIDIYTGWNFTSARISDLVPACFPEPALAGNE